MDNNFTDKTVQEFASEMPPQLSKKKHYTPVHAIFALIAFVIGSLWFRWIFNMNAIGKAPEEVSVTVFALCFSVFAFTFFKLRQAEFSLDSYFLLGLLLIFSLRFCIYPNDYSGIETIAYLVLHLTALLFLYSMGTKKSLDNIVGSAFRSMFVSPFSCFHTIFTAISGFFSRRNKENENPEKKKESGKNFALVLLGILISLPIVLIVISLLLSDSFFSSFLGDIGNISFDFNIAEYFNFITILVSMYIFGALISADKRREKAPAEPANYRFIPVVVSRTMTASLIAVYALFMVAQIDGFVCMFAQTLPENTTYAEFARSGFFELCAASCINGALLYYLNIMTLRTDKKSKNVLQLVLIALTFFLIFTAAFKMIMYIDAYGFTVKRFCTLWFMLLLTIIFSLVIVKLKKESFRLSRYCVYVTAVMLLILFFVDFNGISESLNEAYFSEEIISRR